MAGRKRDAIWTHFDEIQEISTDGNATVSKRAVCRACGKHMAALVDRLYSHSSTCPNVDSQARALIKVRRSSTLNDPNRVVGGTLENFAIRLPANVRRCTCVCSCGARTVGSLAMQVGLPDSNSLPRLTPAVQERISKLIVEFFVRLNVPWIGVEDPSLQELVKMFCPSYTFPSRTVAGTEILDHLLEEACSEISKFCQAAHSITLMSDGWSSSNGYFINWVVSNEEGKSRLYEVEPSTASKTGVQIYEDIKAKVFEISSLHPGKQLDVFFVSDSAGAFRKARELLDENPSSGVRLTSACLAHQSNLLTKDLLRCRGPASVIRRCIAILMFLRSNTSFRNAVNGAARETIKISLPTVTRWYSFALCLKKILEHKAALCKGVVDFEESVSSHPATVTRIIRDDSFWFDVEQLQILLRPYNVVTGLSEMDCCSSALVLTGWAWLIAIVDDCYILSAKEKADFIRRTNKRLSTYIQDHHVACWVLDPRVHGCGLNARGRRFALGAMERLYKRLYSNESKQLERLVAQYTMYISRQDIFSANQSVWRRSYVNSPLFFWNEYSEEAPELSKLAKVVISFVPNSAACERRWSSAGTIARKARNRLKEENFAKIAKVKDYLKKAVCKDSSRLDETISELNVASRLVLKQPPANLLLHATAEHLSDETWVQVCENTGRIHETTDMDTEEDVQSLASFPVAFTRFLGDLEATDVQELDEAANGDLITVSDVQSVLTVDHMERNCHHIVQELSRWLSTD